jgi:CheY-like chemotaxis protein
MPEILLIEDNKDDKDLFELALCASGLQVSLTKAMDATEAVMRLNRKGGAGDLPALIVLDLSLPGLKGRTLLQVVKGAYAPRAIPIVVLTGSLVERDRTDCQALGVDDYLLKPQSFEALVRLVASLRRFFAEPEAPFGGGFKPRYVAASKAT